MTEFSLLSFYQFIHDFILSLHQIHCCWSSFNILFETRSPGLLCSACQVIWPTSCWESSCIHHSFPCRTAEIADVLLSPVLNGFEGSEPDHHACRAWNLLTKLSFQLCVLTGSLPNFSFIHVLYSCMCVYLVCAWYLKKPEEGHQILWYWNNF